MKLQYLGTAAAEGVPALFCHCDTCKYARAHKGKEIRTRSQALLDEKLMLDFGPDTYLHLLANDLDITDLEYCLITHAHEDHIVAEQFGYRKRGFAVLNQGTKPLNVYGSEDIGKMLTGANGSFDENEFVKFWCLKAYQPTKIGEYTVTAFPAVHGTENPFFYSIEKDQKTMLYAHDTDLFKEEVWQYFEKNQIYFDLVSMDCTAGFEKMNYIGHMNFEKNLILKERMINSHLADEKTKFVANHFSHNGHASYEKALEFGRKNDILIAYDGMELNI